MELKQHTPTQAQLDQHRDSYTEKVPTTLNAQAVPQPQADRTAEIVDIMQQQTAKLVAMKALLDTVREKLDGLEGEMDDGPDGEPYSVLNEIRDLLSEEALEQITNPREIAAKPLADAIQEAIKSGNLQPSAEAEAVNMDDPANWSEASRKLWLESMLMNMGLVMHKCDKKTLKIDSKDLQNFVKRYRVKRDDLGKGRFSYSLIRHKL